MVKRENLLAIAGVFWLIAGVNVALVGVQCFLAEPTHQWWWMVLVALGVFSGFFAMFRKVARKHADRILSYPTPRVSVAKTFDVKGYLIIAVMMGGGMALRLFNLVPVAFIGSFYPGLGVALALTGMALLVRRWSGCHCGGPASSHC